MSQGGGLKSAKKVSHIIWLAFSPFSRYAGIKSLTLGAYLEKVDKAIQTIGDTFLADFKPPLVTFDGTVLYSHMI